MQKPESENIVAQINKGVFFKEFTFSKTDFKALDSNKRLEFADNVVWLGELFFIYQIKERKKNSNDDEKWFNNKILKIAVRQTKATLKYIDEYPEISIENEKGHKLDITRARESKVVKKIILYSPNENFSELLRQKKVYDSSEVGLIHLFHIEDYYWICKYLITPAEIKEYLDFREALYMFNKEASNLLPEQYFLGHFLETIDADHFNPQYISNLINKKQESENFGISRLIENFSKNIKLTCYPTDYYPIIREISMLNRFELVEFKRIFSLSIEKSEKEEITLPFRIYVPRTDCGFIFIPLHANKSEHWKTALNNFTLAHKYDSKARKCIGVVIFKYYEDVNFNELFWQFVDYEWEFDENTEKLLTDNFPFRKSTLKHTNNRYKCPTT
ncbi:MAG TPA: hypothetical protein DEO54_07850 [Rikenellaceae bacterium]|nr:MAG: hypothetical protein A2X20_02225 [Bacteroidetes bacterium GWE2_40_15]HBZ26138.1 hypothetical protein [Rikenellaceae bacterium]